MNQAGHEQRRARAAGRICPQERRPEGTGGILATLFDGGERVVSIDSIHWNDRAIYLP
jgi:hypothetical protein